MTPEDLDRLWAHPKTADITIRGRSATATVSVETTCGGIITGRRDMPASYFLERLDLSCRPPKFAPPPRPRRTYRVKEHPEYLAAARRPARPPVDLGGVPRDPGA